VARTCHAQVKDPESSLDMDCRAPRELGDAQAFIGIAYNAF
jgi:hypothetical protein